MAVAKYPCNCVCYSFVCEKRKHIAVKVIAFVLVLAAVVWKGTNVYTHSGMAKASNQQKVDARVQQVCDEMLAVDENAKMYCST